MQMVKAFNGLPRGAKLQLILKREERDCNRYKGLVGKHHRGESVCWEFHKNLTKFAKNPKSSQKHFQHVTPTLRWERTNQATSLGETFVKRLAFLCLNRFCLVSSLLVWCGFVLDRVFVFLFASAFLQVGMSTSTTAQIVRMPGNRKMDTLGARSSIRWGRVFYGH